MQWSLPLNWLAHWLVILWMSLRDLPPFVDQKAHSAAFSLTSDVASSVPAQ